MPLSTTIHLVYPFDDLRAGAGVLATVMRLFGPEDGVDFVVSPAEGVLDTEGFEEFSRLCVELTLRYGLTPPIRVLRSEELPPESVLARIGVTGDPVADADAILRLGSIARHLGGGYAYGNRNRLRGDAELLRLDHDAAALRRVTHPLHREAGRIRVAVIVQRMQVWGAVESIVLAGLRDPRVEMNVVFLPDLSTVGYQAHPVQEFAALRAEQGIAVRSEAWLRTNLGELDVAVVHDAYGNRWSTPRGLSTRELADAGIRVVLAPYAQALSGSPENLDLLHNMPLHNYAWRIFAPSAGAVVNYERYCAAGTAHVRSLGSPKREHLLTDATAMAEAAALRKRLRTRTVTLWNPHFESSDGLGTFEKFVEPVIRWFQARPKQGLILRPHPRLMADYERRDGADSVARFRKMCLKMPNVVLDESVDAARALLASDAMISDLSSLIAEYAALGRPIALLRDDPHLLLNDDREWLENTVFVDDEKALGAFLSSVKRPAEQPATGTHADIGSGERILRAIVEEFQEETGRVTGFEGAVAATEPTLATV